MVYIVTLMVAEPGAGDGWSRWCRWDGMSWIVVGHYTHEYEGRREAMTGHTTWGSMKDLGWIPTRMAP